MSQKNRAKVFLIILILLGAALVGLVIWEAVTNGFSTKLLLRTAAIAASLALAAAKVFSAAGGGNRRLYALYEKEYTEHIGGAFARKEQKKEKALLMEAIHCFNRERYTKGIDILQKLIAKCSKPKDYAAVYTFLGLMYEAVEKRENAIEAYQAVIKYDDSRSTIWSNLGALHRKKGYHKEAVLCYNKAIELDPGNEYAYSNLGISYFRTGDYLNAIEMAEKAYDINPAMRQPYEIMCLSYAALGDEEKSKAYFDSALSVGCDAKVLKDALQRIREDNLEKESLVPIPYEIEKACDTFYRETALPYALIGLTSEKTASRMGGPSLGEPPVDSNGNEMRLLCAIDCTEVRGLADFPEKGVLLFYIADNSLYGADFENPTVQKDFRVIYCPEGQLCVGNDPQESETFPIKGCHNIAFTPETCAMNYCDYRFEDRIDRHLQKAGAPKFHALDEDIQEDIVRRFTNVGHHLYGTPMFAQYDPRENDEFKKYDTLLLQISTHHSQFGTRVLIGDEGTMQFFIPREKLKQKDFSDILYWWDCF